MENNVNLLSSPSKYAVVKLSERQFPGIVIQGDTLNSFVAQLADIASLLEAGELEALKDELRDLSKSLLDARSYYESICRDKNFSLPY